MDNLNVKQVINIIWIIMLIADLCNLFIYHSSISPYMIILKDSIILLLSSEGWKDT